MYSLSLTASERNAIDWIGDRYAHGDNLRRLLEHDCGMSSADIEDEECIGWGEQGDMTFSISEHIAWRIVGIVEEDNLACFSDELRSKLHAFCNKIV